MVLLTITPLIVEALEKRPQTNARTTVGEPSLNHPATGSPISHGQIVDLWRDLQQHDATEYSLENLLKGSSVYIPPPPPKPEPTPEYKALMARLRREEEERKYERMVASTKMPSFAQHFPNATNSIVHSFAEVNRPATKDLGDDDVTFNDVHRQLMLLLNFLVTIIGCAATLWILARWWSTPARLFLTMGGSIVVGIAEVGLYYGYLWHLGEAKKKDAKEKEVRKVLETWVVSKEDASTIKEVDISGQGKDGNAVRLRKVGKEKENTRDGQQVRL